MLPLGTEAPDFHLPNTLDGLEVSLSDSKGPQGTLIIFMCNHCPYVLHLLDKMIEITSKIKGLGINTVAISSNDVENYPDDSPKLMKQLAEDKNFGFPYLYDESQRVALAYEAACTPDFFLFDSKLKLVYRGRFDDARPKNDVPVTGKDLLQAAENLANGVSQIEDQIPSLGCNIKWKKGNEPAGFLS
jgi:peroxiredoxin